jgi:hypothetical protein
LRHAYRGDIRPGFPEGYVPESSSAVAIRFHAGSVGALFTISLHGEKTLYIFSSIISIFIESKSSQNERNIISDIFPSFPAWRSICHPK